MQIKELGEFGVIELLNAMIVEHRAGPDNASPFAFRLLVDTGDDTAAWRAGEATELFTTDTVVEEVHFTRVTIPWRDLGWKSLASNISDIAAMGGLPLFALVTLGLPPETEVEDLKELYGGMLEAGNKYGVAIVGGDMVRSPVVFITMALTGVHSGMPMLRTAARAGDRVGVTGPLGGSGGGLRLMLDGLDASPEAAGYLRRCHRRPEPAVAEGRVLAGAGVLAAMDVSDGLADDLSKLCRASGLSARVFADRVPAHPMLQQTFPDSYLDLALAGGEDYKLLFTATPELMEKVMRLLPGEAAVVGEILAGEPGRVVVVDSAGRETVAGRAGWDHFG
ncbi:MAG: thiamine-phosphate kinase [Dehalococcoidia bacterium]|jgi:thiamine-monophosphate kinase|nr:thiamine-phosphate kinase [Dehalococcoidia bacterium]